MSVAIILSQTNLISPLIEQVLKKEERVHSQLIYSVKKLRTNILIFSLYTFPHIKGAQFHSALKPPS